MNLALLALIVLVLALAGALARSGRRRKMAARRLAQSVGHPSALGDRVGLACRTAEQLAEFGMVATRRRFLVTTPGLDGMYVLHVLVDTIAVGYDTNSGRIFVGIAHSPAEAARMVARHAEIPSPA